MLARARSDDAILVTYGILRSALCCRANGKRLAAALRDRHVAGAERAGEVVPAQRLGVVARDADEALVEDVAKALGRLAAAAASGGDVGLHGPLAVTLLLERGSRLERAGACRCRAARRRRRAGDLRPGGSKLFLRGLGFSGELLGLQLVRSEALSLGVERRP